MDMTVADIRRAYGAGVRESLGLPAPAPTKSRAPEGFGILPDSGKRETWPTGSRRDCRAGKGRYDLLSPYALRRLARHFEAGAVKYGDRNWEKGQPLTRYLDSALRHICGILSGDQTEDHAAAADWNMHCFMHTQEMITAGALPAELDDLPKRGPKGTNP